MNANTALQMFASDFLSAYPGHALAVAALAGDIVARLAFADWLEEQFKEGLILRWTLTQLRYIPEETKPCLQPEVS